MGNTRGWAAGPLGRWAAGPLGRWAAGPLGRWAAGPLGRWAAGPLGRWAAGPLGRWAAGPLGRWAAGPLGRWAAGPLGRWAAGPLGRWAAGPLGRWAAGPLGRWAAGPLGRWAAGPLGRWAAGPLGRWAAGPLGRWAAGPLGDYKELPRMSRAFRTSRVCPPPPGAPERTPARWWRRRSQECHITLACHSCAFVGTSQCYFRAQSNKNGKRCEKTTLTRRRRGDEASGGRPRCAPGSAGSGCEGPGEGAARLAAVLAGESPAGAVLSLAP